MKKVDSGSDDADPAQAMLGSIQRGREALAKQRAEREKLGQAAQTAIQTPAVSIDTEKIIAAGTPDAGPPPDTFGAGALVSDINASTGGCLTDYEPFTEQQTGVTGTIYRVAPSSGCAAKLPGYVGQAVLVVNGRVYRRILDPNPPRPQQLPGQAAPDAGQAAAPPPAPKPAPPAAAADAGEPEYQMVVPGQPQPGAKPPEPPQ